MPSELTSTAEIALDALTAVHSIQTVYTDAVGQTQQVASATQRKVLRALGVRTQSPQGMAAELLRAQQKQWARVLPPTLVVCRHQAPFAVDLVMRAGTREFAWHVDLEGGETISRRADFQSLVLQERRRVDGVWLERRSLCLTAPVPDGYHALRVAPGSELCHFIVSPGTCWVPAPRDDGRRLWGVAVQLPLVRSATNWGIGDFSDLARLVAHAAQHGIDVVGVNPLHAGFPDSPEQASPYSPSSRLLLNTLFIDVGAVRHGQHCQSAQELMRSRMFQEQLRACRESPTVNYAMVTQLKRTVLRLLYDESKQHCDSEEWPQFQQFIATQDESVTGGCVFQALREHFRLMDPDLADWRTWPAQFRRPQSAEVERFALENAEEVQFHLWLQWQAQSQLAGVEAAARAMRVGLYRDLAVGADPAGAEAWGNQAAMLASLRVGAAPDVGSPGGQDWGITPLDPRALREEGYRSFIALLRANMRHAGALRLDHVMALQRLWCIPQGARAADGAYLTYDLGDLLGIVALESQRNECLVVGEDLGTVPSGFRDRLREAQILSYRVLQFERHDRGGFLPPQSYPRLAIAVAGNHDLPPLRGWVLASDREQGPQAQGRQRDLMLLRDALREAGVRVPPHITAPRAQEAFIEAVHRFLGRTPCLVAMAQLDDWTGEVDAVNRPGTADEYPNWRRKLSLTLEQLLESANWRTLRAEELD